MLKNSNQDCITKNLLNCILKSGISEETSAPGIEVGYKVTCKTQPALVSDKTRLLKC